MGRVEIPVFKRCCCCLPLRRGILVWAYFNLVFQGLSLSLNIHLLIIAIQSKFLGAKEITLVAFSCLLTFSSVVYSFLIVVGSHMKSEKLLRIIYIYGAIDLLYSTLYTITFLIVMIYEYNNQKHSHDLEDRSRFGLLILRDTADTAMYLSAEFLLLVFQGYIVLLIRSEMLKLKEQSIKMEFVNNSAESEARCVSANALRKENYDNDDDAESRK